MGDAIRLLDSEGLTTLDSVSTEYEDSFCLETFGDLARAHFNADPKGTKSFIIARVQTWDAKQPEKDFYSYYSALELNKVLFQTQVYLGKKFIHRLHVLNPLTNSDIIGNISYFKVKPLEVLADTTEKALANPRQSVALAPITEDEPKPELKIDVTPRRASFQVVSSPTSLLFARTKEVGGISPAIKEADTGKPANWTHNDHSVAPLNEVEETDTTGTRRISVSRRTSGFTGINRQKAAQVAKRRGSAQESDSEKGIARPRARSLYELELPVRVSSGPASPSYQAPTMPTSRRKSEFPMRIMAKHPDGPVKAGARKKSIALPGTVTRFGVPVDKEEKEKSAPRTTRGTRRSLSYRNAVSATGEQASFEEWVAMLQEEKGISEVKDENFDQVKPMAGRRASVVSQVRQSVTERPLMTSPSGLTPSPELDESTKSFKGESLKIYDAVLFATDNDFLEMSKIRSIFRENAILPEDAKLFEMPEFTGKETTSPSVEILDDPFLCEWCSPTAAQLAHPNIGMRLFYKYKCYGLGFLVVVIILIFIIVLVLKQTSS